MRKSIFIKIIIENYEGKNSYNMDVLSVYIYSIFDTMMCTMVRTRSVQFGKINIVYYMFVYYYIM